MELKNKYSEIFSSYKGRAKSDNINFYLCYEFFESLVTKNCHYCGREPLKVKSTDKVFYEWNGIDRIDSNKDYSEGNCVTCCYICNKGKSDHNKEWYDMHLWHVTRHKIITTYGKEVWDYICKSKVVNEEVYQGWGWHDTVGKDLK